MPSKSQSSLSANSGRAALGSHQPNRRGTRYFSLPNESAFMPGLRHEMRTKAFTAKIGRHQDRVLGSTRLRAPLPDKMTTVRSMPTEPHNEMGVRTQSA